LGSLGARHFTHNCFSSDSSKFSVLSAIQTTPYLASPVASIAVIIIAARFH
jgi:hypothetical protein